MNCVKCKKYLRKYVKRNLCHKCNHETGGDLKTLVSNASAASTINSGLSFTGRQSAFEDKSKIKNTKKDKIQSRVLEEWFNDMMM